METMHMRVRSKYCQYSFLYQESLSVKIRSVKQPDAWRTFKVNIGVGKRTGDLLKGYSPFGFSGQS